MKNSNLMEMIALANSKMASVDQVYRPTTFWEQACLNIASALEAEGIENFRHSNIALDYFVPTYGSPGNSISANSNSALLNVATDELSGKALIAAKSFLSGELLAYADFRTFIAGDNPSQLPNLQKFSESSCGLPVEHFEFENRFYSRSSLNYLLGLVFLKKHIGNFIPKTILEIGGGFGTLGEIYAASNVDDFRYINIDVPPMNFVSEYYLRQSNPGIPVAGFVDYINEHKIHIDELPPLNSLSSWQIANLQGEVDLFVNFISFQEMEPEVVDNYLAQVSRLKAKWVLLRNLREGKPKITTFNQEGVLNPILTQDYVDALKNYELVDSNIIPFGHKTPDNFHSELLLFKIKSQK